MKISQYGDNMHGKGPKHRKKRTYQIKIERASLVQRRRERNIKIQTGENKIQEKELSRGINTYTYTVLNG